MNNQEAKKILQRDLEILIENKSLPDDTIEKNAMAIQKKIEYVRMVKSLWINFPFVVKK